MSITTPPSPRIGAPDPYEAKRAALRARYLGDAGAESTALATAGVDHLALICSDLEATVDFYTGVLAMRLTRVIPNRDEPTSTHVFLDMGGGNQLAFFDFPRHGPARTVRGVGSMHHVALKASPERYQAVLRNLEARGLPHSIHGDRERGSVYLRDPDDILVEVTTGYGPQPVSAGDPGTIHGYHAHVYYDAASKPAAAVLREEVERRFPVTVGRWHDEPVGPHPTGSYQIAFEPARFGEIVPWLALNRGELVVLVHPVTADVMRDHTTHAIWLGPGQTLDLAALERAVAARAGRPA